MDVAMIGLGRMGGPMARWLSSAGFTVHGVDLDPDARARAEQVGVSTSDSLEHVAGCTVVCSSLPDTPHARSVYLDAGGVLDRVAEGTVCFDLSTISPTASVEIAEAARKRGVAFLDAPVSGTSLHAEEGTLAIIVGGDGAALESGRTVLESFSSSIHHVGDNGAGLRLKLVHNRLLSNHLVAIAEAIVELEEAGLDVTAGIELFRAGAIPKLLNYKAEPMSRRDFSPAFTVDLMRKDLRIARDERAPGAMSEITARVLDETAALGYGDADMNALISVIEKETPR